MNAATGEVPKIFADFPVARKAFLCSLWRKWLTGWKDLTLDGFCERFNQAPDTYLPLGWLTGPRLLTKVLPVRPLTPSPKTLSYEIMVSASHYWETRCQ